MARDMFGDVVDPSIKVGSKKWYTVPLSIAVHTAILLALVNGQPVQLTLRRLLQEFLQYREHTLIRRPGNWRRRGSLAICTIGGLRCITIAAINRAISVWRVSFVVSHTTIQGCANLPWPNSSWPHSLFARASASPSYLNHKHGRLIWSAAWVGSGFLLR